jgi:hypothetical protein
MLTKTLKTLQAYVEHEFKSLPGSDLVSQGRYYLLNAANNERLDDWRWESKITPGSTIAMSMIIRKRLALASYAEEQCPDPKCSGTWLKKRPSEWFQNSFTWYLLIISQKKSSANWSEQPAL